MTSSRKPDLMIVGAQKSGTTSLFRYLAETPGVVGHTASEMTFYLNQHQVEMGYDVAYQRHFAAVDDGQSSIVAKHAMLLYSPEGLERLREHSPNTRVVVLLREPVSRAESAYSYAVRRGWEPLSTFADALAAEEQRLRDDGWMKWRDCAYFSNGDYPSHIEVLWRVFGRDAVTIMFLDDFVKDPVAACSPLCDILSIERSALKERVEKHNVAAAPRSKMVSKAMAGLFRSRHPIKLWGRKMLSDKMAAKIRKELLAVNDSTASPQQADPKCLNDLRVRYAPTVDRLESLLGRPLDGWRQGQCDG